MKNFLRLTDLQKVEYKENALSYEDYCRLRESAGWQLFAEEQMQNALDSSFYTITVVDGSRTVGMGRLIGDGMYYMLADIVVAPEYQKKGIGSQIVNRLLQYVEEATPSGGRSSIQLIAEKDKEFFYEKTGFKRIPHEYCGSGMRKVVHK